MARMAWLVALAGWAVAGFALGAAGRAREAAETDPLTGLRNRRGLARAWTRGCLRLHFLDLSGFRAVNGAHGHAVGDQVLEKVARRLEAALPDGSALFRHGGDEFVVLAPPATDVATALSNAVAAPFPLPGGGAVSLGLWLGQASPGAATLDAALGEAIADMGRRRAGAGGSVASASAEVQAG
jgi:GGDEF domain-containing protein